MNKVICKLLINIVSVDWIVFCKCYMDSEDIFFYIKVLDFFENLVILYWLLILLL